MSGDKIRMTQVLINLSKMAQKFQRQSGGEIKMKVAFDYEHELLKVHILNTELQVRDQE